MKKLMIALSFFALTAITANAQVNKDKNQSTTVKKVTQKGTNVRTQVITNTQREDEVLQIDDNGKQDQNSRVQKNISQDSQIVADDISVDAANQQNRMAIKVQQQKELQNKIQAQNEKAAMEAEKERAAKKMELQKQLEERRAALEKRPEGMSKLSKNRDK